MFQTALWPAQHPAARCQLLAVGLQAEASTAVHAGEGRAARAARPLARRAWADIVPHGPT